MARSGSRVGSRDEGVAARTVGTGRQVVIRPGEVTASRLERLASERPGRERVIPPSFAGTAHGGAHAQLVRWGPPSPQVASEDAGQHRVAKSLWEENVWSLSLSGASSGLTEKCHNVLPSNGC